MLVVSEQSSRCWVHGCLPSPCRPPSTIRTPASPLASDPCLGAPVLLAGCSQQAEPMLAALRVASMATLGAHGCATHTCTQSHTYMQRDACAYTHARTCRHAHTWTETWAHVTQTCMWWTWVSRRTHRHGHMEVWTHRHRCTRAPTRTCTVTGTHRHMPMGAHTHRHTCMHEDKL